jgi:hypothetical protein
MESALSAAMRAAMIAFVTAALCGSATAGAVVTANDPSADDATRAVEVAALAKRLPANSGDVHVDISVADLDVEIGDQVIALAAVVHVAVCDEHGTMKSIVSGAARLEIPASQYRARRLPMLRRDVVTAAIEGVADKVSAQLPASRSPQWLTRWVGWFMQSRAVGQLDTRPSS